MHFIENVAVLAPLNYVLIVHRNALSKERIDLLEEYEQNGAREQSKQRKTPSLNISQNLN